MSRLGYQPLNPQAQVLVIICPMQQRDEVLKERWRERAVALLEDTAQHLRDIVRDLLANPQVRAVVFDGEVCCRDAFDAFWLGEAKPTWHIDDEHLTLVRQFVDLYDDDCGIKAPMQPYWPARIQYLDETKETT